MTDVEHRLLNGIAAKYPIRPAASASTIYFIRYNFSIALVENPIAFMWQSARKSGKSITWVDAHSRKEVRDFIISINEDRNPEEYTSIMDIDKDVPEFWLKNPYE